MAPPDAWLRCFEAQLLQFLQKAAAEITGRPDSRQCLAGDFRAK